MVNIDVVSNLNFLTPFYKAYNLHHSFFSKNADFKGLVKYNHASEPLLVEYTTLSCSYWYPSYLMVVNKSTPNA
ncbi:hypothetical protein ACLGC0_06105 [Helicobacter pylori]